MSMKKLKSSGLLRLESKSVDKTEANNNLVKKSANVKIVRKKTDGQVERTLTGTVPLQKEGDKVVKRKVLKKAQEGGATVAVNVSSIGNGGSTGNDGSIGNDGSAANMAESSTLKEEKKSYVVRKAAAKFSARAGKTNEAAHRDPLGDDDEGDGEESPKGNLEYDDAGSGNGKDYQDNNSPAGDEAPPPHAAKKIVKKKKPIEREPNRSNPNANDAIPGTQFEHPGNPNGRSDKSDKVEDDSENEILNSIICKNDESALAEAPKEVKKKKKKIIVRKKVPIGEKLKGAEKGNQSPGVRTTPGAQTTPGGWTPRVATTVTTNGNSGGNSGGQPNECCERMANEIKMSETKIAQMQQTYEEKMSSVVEENKKEKDQLNTYIQNLNEEMHNINNKLSDEVKEKNTLKESYQNLRSDKLELEEKVNMLTRQMDESNEMSLLLNAKVATLEEENKMLLDRDQQNDLKVEQLQGEKIKMEKKMDEQNLLIKKKNELINKYMSEIENYKNVLKSKGEMMILGSSTTIDKSVPDKNSQKEQVAKLVKEKKELIYAFKKQLDLIVILKKQISLLESNKIVNMTSGELKKVLHD
ncbi:hypothetical protein PVMG_04791 [Plasmodium vivax Mauritania I]|uniref:Uncharacterized protein n=1 Tax=Plasmodium vivax Mauritania I TaxID=1035515 RepID=A0A0J9TJP7_PLAVI|nr:hypothetical protein PVMG_04791 [Plasmodium vivax Mauritania I]